jgi:hypothetical protein
MNRLKKSWAWLAFPALCSVAAVGAWGYFANRDADFQRIGPMTENLGPMLDALDMRVAPADFQECATLADALDLLEVKCQEKGVVLDISIDRDTTEIEDYHVAKVRIPNDSRPVTVKQFLRMAFSQVTAKEITFLLRPYHCHVEGGQIWVTTAADVNRQRARYEERYHVTCIDRIHQSFAELLGREGPLPQFSGVATK